MTEQDCYAVIFPASTVEKNPYNLLISQGLRDFLLTGLVRLERTT